MHTQHTHTKKHNEIHFTIHLSSSQTNILNLAQPKIPKIFVNTPETPEKSNGLRVKDIIFFSGLLRQDALKDLTFIRMTAKILVIRLE